MVKYFMRVQLFLKVNGRFMELVYKILIKWSEKGRILLKVFGNNRFCSENGRWPTVIFNSGIVKGSSYYCTRIQTILNLIRIVY